MNKKILSTGDAPAAIGPYSQGVDTGSLVALSGQIPLDPVTGQLVEGDICAQTRQCFENITAVLRTAGLNFENVIKTTVFLADIADFAAMNEVYATYFTGDCPARSAVQVAALPRGAKVEIEVLCVR